MKGFWTMRDGDHIPIPEMSDSHLINSAKMLGRNLASYPGEQFYLGDSPYAEQAVDSENQRNMAQARRISSKLVELQAEMRSRGIIEQVGLSSLGGSDAKK